MNALQAERQVVAACASFATALVKVRDWLKPAHFAQAELGRLYAHLLTLQPEQIDPVTVGITAEEQGTGWTGADVIDLAGELLSASNVEAYGELVLEAGKRRALVALGEQMATRAARAESAESVATWAQSKLTAVCAAEAKSGPRGAKPVLREWMAEFQRRMASTGRITGLPTPWQRLNEATAGLQAGRLYVAAGRPGMGKSVIGENISTHEALRGGHPLVFSLEMTGAEWKDRSIAQLGRVPGDFLRSPAQGWYDDGSLYQARIGAAVERLLETRIELDEQPSLTLQQIEARAERVHLRDPLTLIVIDHLHIMGRPRQNDVSELGAITSGLKRLAKRLGVPVLLLAQLNRAVTEQSDKRPSLANLRGSGAIEEDADVILLLHREDYYRKDDEPRDHLLRMYVEKNRGGEKGIAINLREAFAQYRADDWDGPLPETNTHTTPRGFGRIARAN
jgi:replicative DNA helicase